MAVSRDRPLRAAIVAALLVAAAACGSPAAEEATTLRVVMADDWVTAPVVADAVRDFEQANPAVRVQLQGVPFAQIPDTVRGAEGSDTPFDVAQWHAFAAAERDIAQDLTDLWERDLDRGDFAPGAVEDVEWAGRLYGVPLDTNALVLLANEAALGRVGVDTADLDTFEGFRRAARAVAAPSRDRWGLAIPSSSWVAYGWIRAFGGELVTVTEEGPEFGFTSPQVIDALTFLGDLINRDRVAPRPFARDVTVDAVALFESGAVAMHTTGTWDVDALKDQPADARFPLAVQPLPHGPAGPGTVIGGSSMFVPTGSRQRELAWEFMNHLVQDEYARRLVLEEGRLPVKRAQLADPVIREERPEYAVVLDQIPNASAMKLIAFPEATNAFQEALEQILVGGGDVRRLMQGVQRDAERTAAG